MKELRPYQTDSIVALWQFWRKSPAGHPLIVASTGAGKSIILAEICRRILTAKPNYKILIVSHSREIVKQDAAELYELLQIPIGIYSAGLGIKQIRSITCANVQSLYKKKTEFEVMAIDEAHLCSGKDESMYGKLLSNNTALKKVIGVTASPWRMDCGSLIENGVFTDICYDIDINTLIAGGYLSPPVSCPASKIDFSDVSKSGYDYNQGKLEKKMLPYVNEHAASIIKESADRKRVLIFCSGVEHCKQIAERLPDSAVITGDTLPMQRDIILKRFSTGEIKYLVNCAVLLVGFNEPGIDAVALLRATQSPVLYLQSIGRGLRNYPGKVNCKVIDHGGNVRRFGPIDCLKFERKNKTGKIELKKAPSKECSNCGCIVAIRTLICPNCGAPFTIESTKFTPEPETAPVLSVPEIWDVTDWKIKIHNKPGKPPSLMLRFNSACEFLCFEHGGYADNVGRRKWHMYGGLSPAPSTTLEASNRSGELRIPAQIEVKKEGKFYRILKLIGEQSREYQPTEGDLADHI